MRWLALVGGAGLVAACASFSATDNGAAVDAADGAADARADGAADARGDGASGGRDADDGAAGDARDGSAAECTSFATGVDGTVWNRDVTGPGSLTMETFAGRGAQVVRVASGPQRALLLRALPARSNAQTITVDLWLAAGTTVAWSWIADLVTLRCPSPELTASFGIAPGNDLDVSSRPSDAARSFGALVTGSGWQKVVVTVDGTSITSTYAGQSTAITVSTSFSSRVGCTLEIGANVMGNIPEVTAAFSSVCVE